MKTEYSKAAKDKWSRGFVGLGVRDQGFREQSLGLRGLGCRWSGPR